MPLPKPDRKPDALRSRTMRAVKSADTKPELTVRRIVHGLGRRYRLNVKRLPGAPDIALAKDKKAIFVHGCFWHGHHCKRGARIPKTNRAYWEAKVTRNKARDAKALAALAELGWATLVIWECEIKDTETLKGRLSRFLETSRNATNRD